MKLEISDAHEGIKAATARVLSTTWQRCRVHFQRNALAHAGKSSRRVVSAFIATAFAQPDHATAKTQWRLVADQMRPKLPKLATLMDTAEEDVLAYTSSGVRISILPDTTVGERPFLNSVILKPPLHRRGQFIMSTGGQFAVSPDTASYTISWDITKPCSGGCPPFAFAACSVGPCPAHGLK